jgi:hypothetical protein
LTHGASTSRILLAIKPPQCLKEGIEGGEDDVGGAGILGEPILEPVYKRNLVMSAAREFSERSERVKESR